MVTKYYILESILSFSRNSHIIITSHLRTASQTSVVVINFRCVTKFYFRHIELSAIGGWFDSLEPVTNCGVATRAVSKFFDLLF
jgi:predicted house-cleaning NTP pyrophosphatase (Maf/HAM1 superfamily)